MAKATKTTDTKAVAPAKKAATKAVAKKDNPVVKKSAVPKETKAKIVKAESSAPKAKEGSKYSGEY